MEQDILYHRSQILFEGNLMPKKPNGNNFWSDSLCAVYATSVRELAIVHAILKCDGVENSYWSLHEEPYGLICSGWPKNEHIYLYTLPFNEFKQIGRAEQYVSFNPIKPIKIEKLTVSDNINLVSVGTKDERFRRKLYFDFI